MAALASLLAASICLAGSPEVKAVEAQRRAAEALEARFEAARAGGPVPRRTDPGVASELAALADERGLLAAPFTEDALEDRMERCARPGKVTVAYLLSGFQAAAGESNDEATRRLTAIYLRNGATFQDEVAPLLAFSTRCFGGVAEVLPRWAAARIKEPVPAVQREGVARIRLGMLQIFVGALTSAKETQTRAANSRRLVQAAADAAPAISAIMRPADRAVVLQVLGTVPPTSETSGDLARIERAMKRTDCAGICAL